jgi:hypothetical protein
VFWPAKVTDRSGVQEGVCFNVSNGGIGVYLWSPPSANQVVAIDVNLPHGDPASARARIVPGPRGRGRAVGLEFVEVTPDLLVCLVSHVATEPESGESTEKGPAPT